MSWINQTASRIRNEAGKLSAPEKFAWGALALGCLIALLFWRPKSMPTDARLVVSLIAMFLLASFRWAEGRPAVYHRVLLAALAGLLFLSAYWQNSREIRRLTQGKYIQVWNGYHYYLGAKYFDELGYKDLYNYTLLADDEAGLGLKKVRKTMNLHTYRLISRREAVGMIEKNNFSPERWEEFKGDLKKFVKLDKRKRFKRILQDHGYNATPFNNTVYWALAETFPVNSRWARLIAFGLDSFLLVLAFLMVGWAFGAQRAMVAALFFTLFFGVHKLQVGAFLRYDWFVVTVIGVCCFKKRRYKSAGVLLAYGAMTRIFPGFLLIGPTLLFGRDLLIHKRVDHGFVQLLTAFFVACAIFFPVGAANAHGFSAWGEFIENIRLHSEKHYLGRKRMGLKKIFSYDFSENRLPRGDDARAERYEKQKGMHYAVMGSLWLLFGIAALRTSKLRAMGLGMCAIFFTVVLSRYYWALWCVLFAMSPRDGPQRSVRNAVYDLVMFSWVPIFYAIKLTEENIYLRYQYIGFVMAVQLIFLMAFEIARSRDGDVDSTLTPDF